MNEEVEAQAPPRTSGLAVAALILAFTCVGSPIALILGIIALVQIAGNPRLRGQGLAIAGVIVSVLAMFVLLMIAAISIPAFVKAREHARQANCISNIKQLNTALLMYAADHDGHFPPANGWNGTLRPYYNKNDRVLICPSDKTGGPSYGMNDRIAGIAQRDVTAPGELVSFFDSKPGRDQSDGPKLLPSPPRHPDGNNVGFVDGHVASVEDPHTLIWSPGAPLSGVPEPVPAPLPVR